MNISSLENTKILGAAVAICILCPPAAEGLFIAFYLGDVLVGRTPTKSLWLIIVILFGLIFFMIIYFRAFIRKYKLAGCRDRVLAILSIYNVLMTFAIQLGWATKSIIILVAVAFLGNFCHNRLKKMSSRVFFPLLYSSQASLLIIGFFSYIIGFYNDDLEKSLSFYIGSRCIITFFLVRTVTNYYRCYPDLLKLKN